MSTPKLIIGREFLSVLNEIGLLPKNCRRVVIDAEAGDVVKLYYECIGDERLLEVVRASRLQVIEKEKP